MSAPLVVAGLGRCGTSLVMQMLAAGGVLCLGDYPSFESREPVQPGQAVKILDPQSAHPIPYAIPARARVIWLDRDPDEQAASHAKFLATLTGRNYNRDERRRLCASMRRDRGRALCSIGTRLELKLAFEDILTDPRGAATLLAAIAGDGFDTEAAARQVRRREPKCLPGLDLELTLLASSPQPQRNHR